MVVRGAPAIGITAAYGVVLAARKAYATDPGNWRESIKPYLQKLGESRPTAVNLHWALERMQARMETVDGDPVDPLLQEALAIHKEDIAANQQMGTLGAAVISKVDSVLTHCNAGALATGGYGTALGVIRSAFDRGDLKRVYACETRPWLQGARLTAWELQKDHIPVTLIVDSAASYLMQQGQVQWVIVGADRIAANGDVANKIGTYALAISARHHGVKFMVAAPLSTIDPDCESGHTIPIENRSGDEILGYSGTETAPEGTAVFNPAFDITPADLVDLIVTEKGVIEKPDRAKIRPLFD